MKDLCLSSGRAAVVTTAGTGDMVMARVEGVLPDTVTEHHLAMPDAVGLTEKALTSQ